MKIVIVNISFFEFGLLAKSNISGHLYGYGLVWKTRRILQKIFIILCIKRKYFEKFLFMKY